MTNKINGEKFFNKLYKDEDFCKQLGKVILSAGKLEAQLIKLIENNENDKKCNYYNLTMGKLIGKVEKLKLLPENTIETLKLLSEQRNHLTHNIFIIFSDLIEDTNLIENINSDKYYKTEILKQSSEEKEYFSYDDTHVYIERAYILADNLNGLANIISNLTKQ